MIVIVVSIIIVEDDLVSSDSPGICLDVDCKVGDVAEFGIFVVVVAIDVIGVIF